MRVYISSNLPGVQRGCHNREEEEGRRRRKRRRRMHTWCSKRPS
jgi:hypothetical protein